MPKALHDKLARQAAKHGYTGERADHYVYGTLEKIKHGSGSKANPGHAKTKHELGNG